MKKTKRCRHNSATPEAEAEAAAAAAIPFPQEIMCDILARLELQELDHCRFVCKAWYKLIIDTYFANLHLSRLLRQPQPHSNFLIMYSPPTKSLFLVDLNSTKLESGLGLNASNPLPLSSDCFPNQSPFLVGSCNGLLCLQGAHCIHNPVTSNTEFRFYYVNHSDFCSYYILNPVTNQIARLPFAPPMDTPSQCLGNPPSDSWFGSTYITAPSGFAFDDTTKTYKLIQAWSFHDQSGKVVKAVFNMLTVGSSKWTRIHEMSAMFLKDQSPPVFVNNTLHWQMASLSIGGIRLGETPTFVALQPPPDTNHVMYRCLTSLNGCLSLVWETEYNKIVVWTMNEYGVDSPWSKKFSLLLAKVTPRLPIRRSRQSIKSKNGFRILTALNNKGSIILVSDGEYLIYCDLDKNERRILEIDGIPTANSRSYTLPLAHMGSLISPTTITASAQINVRPRRKNVVRRSYREY